MTLDLLIEPLPFGALDGEEDRELLDGPAFAGLTTAEKKALAITSQLETGQRGGFYGLTGNFDKMGLSYGLVNWNIGAGSLQPLLRDFLTAFPDRWKAAFRDDADRFASVIRPTGKAAEQAQLKFVIDELNERVVRKGKSKWIIKESWASHFRRLAEDPEFRKIQVRYARDLLERAKYYCDYFGLRSERAFCMMFDAVASHGKWWLFKKRDGVEKRRQVLRAKLDALATTHGKDVPELAKLRAVAEAIGETSSSTWRDRALARKLWFVTGKHDRAKELVGLEPTDEPFTTSDGATAPPAPRPAPPATPLDPAIITAFVFGQRNHEDITDVVFSHRHPERRGRRIGSDETAAKAEWKAIRARVAELLPQLDRTPQGELSTSNEDMIARPIVLMHLATGVRDPARLASEAFYALHPERERRPIEKHETAAIAQWRRLRDGLVVPLLRPSSTPTSKLAALAKSETGAGGKTLYFEIPLAAGDARQLTSVFVPDGFRPSAEVDVILYLHGHKAGPYRQGAIDAYWKQERRAPVREAVAQSSKNAILVAPTLGPRSQAGTLGNPGGLDRYLQRVTTALAPHGWNGQPPRLRHLVLAAHSGGGIHMVGLATASDEASTRNVRECWGFDCFYNPDRDRGWIEWARRDPDRRLYGYIETAQVRDRVARWSKAAPPNIVLGKASTSGAAHWNALRGDFAKRIDGAAFLDAR